MQRLIAFYVHHHGRGHITRTRTLLQALDSPAAVLTSAAVEPDEMAGAAFVPLPMDTPVDPDVATSPAPPHLHYAPLGVAGQRARVARIAQFVSMAAPALLVVDVSSEVAQLGRLTGTPTVVVRQHGERWDAGHRAAYDSAIELLAPFGPELEEPDVPEDVRERTFYAGGLGRVGSIEAIGRQEARRRLGWDPELPTVVVLCGRGGDGPSDAEIVAAAGATSPHRWVVVGDRNITNDRIETMGWVDDPMLQLTAADVVVGSAGHNTVMEVAAARRPFVCLPQERPFDEQVRKAARLASLDAAEVLGSWPAPGRWPAILRRAAVRGGDRLASQADPGAADRAARWLDGLVERYAV